MTSLLFFLTYRREVLVLTREEDENMKKIMGARNVRQRDEWKH